MIRVRKCRSIIYLKYNSNSNSKKWILLIKMSQGARIFFVGSVILTGITVLGVNYFIDEEKKVIETLI